MKQKIPSTAENAKLSLWSFRSWFFSGLECQVAEILDFNACSSLVFHFLALACEEINQLPSYLLFLKVCGNQLTPKSVPHWRYLCSEPRFVNVDKKKATRCDGDLLRDLIIDWVPRGWSQLTSCKTVALFSFPEFAMWIIEIWFFFRKDDRHSARSSMIHTGKFVPTANFGIPLAQQK